jgi:acyl dehydratase
MVTRGVYTAAEQQMVDNTNKLADTIEGWAKSPTPMVATAESMKRYGRCLDYWNPLFYDDAYAANTRWGSIIAAPFYDDRFSMGGGGEIDMMATPELGLHRHPVHWISDYEFFKPIRPGDTFKVWRRHPVIEDVTDLDGNGPRQFNVQSFTDLINQNDELVLSLRRLLGNAYKNEPISIRNNEPHKYTKAELELIARTEDEEEVRGANIRYWEDVKEGDDIRPVIMGPTSVIDMFRYTSWMMENYLPAREMRKGPGGGGFSVDPVTGVSHWAMEGHYWDRGSPLFGYTTHAQHWMVSQRDLMSRVVTNWMGDDGFMRKFYFEADGTDILKDVLPDKQVDRWAGHSIGDTDITRGKVTKKRVENSEHLVDLVLWMEDSLGIPSNAGRATVRLCSKEAPFSWK